MRCPFCDHPDSKVLESRPTEEGAVIRRRRECPACGQRFTTYEKVQFAPLMVIKKDGRREAFDPQKILAGIVTACEKRPVPYEAIERIVAEIERELRGRLDKEVRTQEIGEMVMERLRKLDEVAYVRFASVYRQFKDIQRFKEELERLMEQS
ncbi:MAG: transcriptional repressor NrdR [Firmicutes bacterium]|nr:transcriptional repressor NrdR [Bacillota bacterium]